MPTRQDLRSYLRHQGFALKRATKDEIWERVNPDGTIDRVRCSKGRGEIRSHLWAFIKKSQLGGITDANFNRGRKEK